MFEREEPGDPAAPVVPNYRRPLDAEPVEELEDVGCQAVVGVVTDEPRR
jgi:hypothetical protein